MARLRHLFSDQTYLLGAHTVVGRGVGVSMRLYSPSVSTEHASLRFHEGQWLLRDLGSRNGTLVNGRLCQPFSTYALTPGMKVMFGVEGETWEVMDVSPPVAMARCGEAIVIADDGVIALPSAETPFTAIFCHNTLGWVIEREGALEPLHDGDVFTVGGEAWSISLPLETGSTLVEREAPVRLEDVALVFQHLHSTLAVRIRVLSSATERALPERTYHGVTLALALAHIEDRHLSVPERGWRDRAALAERLGLSEKTFGVYLWRTRKLFEQAGVLNTHHLFETRTSGEVRLLPLPLSILPLDGAPTSLEPL